MISLGMPSKRVVDYLERPTYTYFGSVGADHEHYADITELTGELGPLPAEPQIGIQHCLKGEQINNDSITYIKAGEKSHLTSLGSTCIGSWLGNSKLLYVNCQNVTEIGYGAFQYCSNLSSVNCQNVTEIGYGAFQYCSNLSSVNCPNVSSIGGCAFNSCPNLKHLYLSSVTGVTTLGDNVFNDMSNCYVYVPRNLIENFKEDPTWKTYLEAGNIVFAVADSYTYFGSVGADHEHYADITELNSSSTQCLEGEPVNNTDITYVNSDEYSKLSGIGSHAFYQCTNLSSVNCPNVTNIEADAFQYCSNLSSVNCPNVSSIGDWAFYQCTNLSSVNCPNVTYIGGCAFSWCSNLSSINCPNVTYIGGMQAFGCCSSLTSINLPNITVIADTLFSDCSNLTSINCPNASWIAYGAFRNCANLKHLYLSSVTGVTTVESIDSEVFYGVSHCSVYVPNSLLEDFKIATNWSTYLAYENIDFVGV